MKGIVTIMKNDRITQHDFSNCLWRGPFIAGDQVDMTGMDELSLLEVGVTNRDRGHSICGSEENRTILHEQPYQNVIFPKGKRKIWCLLYRKTSRGVSEGKSDHKEEKNWRMAVQELTPDWLGNLD